MKAYQHQLLTTWVKPWLAGFILLMLTSSTLLYWQYTQYQQLATKYKNAHSTLLKQQSQLKQLYAAYQKTQKARKNFSQLKKMGLFNTPDRVQWIDALLFYSAGWVWPDLKADLSSSKPLLKDNLLKTVSLSIEIKAYSEFDLLYLYKSLRSKMTPYIDWQTCTWEPRKSSKASTISTSAKSTSNINVELQKYIHNQLIKARPSLHLINTSCKFNIIYALPINKQRKIPDSKNREPETP